MSSVFSILVIKSSTEQTCQRDSHRLLNYFLDKEILVADGDLLKPGLRAETILEPQPTITAEEKAAIEKMCRENGWSYPKPFSIFDMADNTAQLLIGRRVFSEAEDAKFRLICRICKTDFDGFQTPVLELLNDFYTGGEPAFNCPACNSSELLRLCDTRGFAAGFLALEFSNWGMLSEGFSIELATDLGFQVARIFGRI